MTEHHGAVTIKKWLEDLVRVVRSGKDFQTSAGAEPNRSYAYLEYHLSEDEHSILVFALEEGDEGPEVRAHRFEGDAETVRDQVDALTHGG